MIGLSSFVLRQYRKGYMPDLDLEWQLQHRGIRLVAGVDEAGRGPLAGPVVAASVILPPDLSGHEPWLSMVDDSKRLSPLQREKAAEFIQRHALAVSVGQVGPEEIDCRGIVPATIKAMLQAVAGLTIQPEHLLLDSIPIKECSLPFHSVVKGDALSYSIAAASIIAKVTRDRLMEQADPLYPGYYFAQNKGYPTAHHLAQLQFLGPCSIHRRSFAPVQQAIISRGGFLV
jgi:ribonuclease HII